MIERSPSRSHGSLVSRRQLLVASVGVAVGTAGCTDALFGDEDDDTGPTALEDFVPAETGVLAALDVTELGGDEYDRLLDELTDIESGTIDLEGTLSGLEAETGLDLREAERVLPFDDDSAASEEAEDESANDDEDEAANDDEARNDDENEARNEAEGGNGAGNGSAAVETAPVTALLEGDWSTAEVIDAIETQQEIAYEATDFDGELYEPADESGATEQLAVGVAGEGQFVVGERDDVRETLEIRYGDGEPVSGRLREAHDEQDAQFTVVTEAAGTFDPDELDAFGVPIPGSLDIFEEVDVVSRAYDVTDEGMHLEAGLYTDDESDAEELEDVVGGAIAALRSTSGDEISSALEEVELERDESVVRIRYEGDEDAVISLIEEV